MFSGGYAQPVPETAPCHAALFLTGKCPVTDFHHQHFPRSAHTTDCHLRQPGTFGKETVIYCLSPVCCHHPGTHKGDDTTDGRTVPVFGCPVCAFGTAPAGSVGKAHFRGKHCRNVCGAQKTPDHAGHYHDRPDLGFP